MAYLNLLKVGCMMSHTSLLDLQGLNSMIKLILTLFVITISQNAIARWAFVADGEKAHQKVYVDYSMVPQPDNLVTMLDLFDYKSTQESTDAKYLSSKTLSEYSCTEKTTRVIAITNYAGHMGSGKIVYSSKDNPDKEYQAIEPKSISEKLWVIACKQM